MAIARSTWYAFTVCSLILGPFGGAQGRPLDAAQGRPGAVVAQPRYKVDRKFIRPAELKADPSQTPAVLAGDTLYISGQTDRNPLTGQQPAGIAARTRVAMDNVGRVLRAAGLDFGNVVSCHVQLANMDDFAGMNEVYGGYFGPDLYPARTTIALPALPDGASVEVTCIAYTDKSKIAAVVPPAGAIPAAVGPYKPAVWAGDTLYVSGNGGRDPKTNAVAPTIEAQTKQTLDTIGQTLAAAGLKHKDTVFTNLYFLDPDGPKGPTYGQINSVYRDAFALGTAPSRASFIVAKLPGDISVEMTFIATRDAAHKGRVVPDSAGPSPTSSNGGVLSGDTLYTSAKSGSGDTLEAQFRSSLDSIRDILGLAGLGMEHIVDAHVYLQDITKTATMNAVWAEYFPNNPPARTTVQVTEQQLEQVQVVAVR
jgi:2-iminobutanoate/2-iminopropanoate deaminase